LRWNSLDSDELPSGKKDEIQPTGLASTIDVDPVVSLLFSDVLGGFVSASGHRDGLGRDSIYAFFGRRDGRSVS